MQEFESNKERGTCKKEKCFNVRVFQVLNRKNQLKENMHLTSINESKTTHLSVFDFSFDDVDFGNSIPTLTVSAFLSFGIDLLLLLLFILLFVLVVVSVVAVAAAAMELAGVALIDAVMRVFVVVLTGNLLLNVDDDVVADVVVVAVINGPIVDTTDAVFVTPLNKPFTILLLVLDDEWSLFIKLLLLSSILSILILKFVLSNVGDVVEFVDPAIEVTVGAGVAAAAAADALVGVNCDKWILRLFIGVVPEVVALLWNL